MKRKHVLILSLLLLALNLSAAKHSATFPLGTYANIRNSFPFFWENREELFRHMELLGYNAAIVETDAKDPDLPGMFEIMDRHGLDAVMNDYSWSNDVKSSFHYATSALSSANYNRFEAEFAGEADIKPGDHYDSFYWYASHKDQDPKRVGSVLADPKASYGHSWFVARGETPGYAYTDLKYRWMNKWGGYSRVGKAWWVYQTNAPSFKDQYFRIRYRFKITNLQPGLTAADTLLTFSPSGFQVEKGTYLKSPVGLKHQRPETGSIVNQETHFTVGDLKTTSTADGYVTVELKLPYTELLAAKLLSPDLDNNPATEQSYMVMKLENLNPRLWWHGKCDLYLDYIEYEDQMHYNLVNQREQYQAGISKRVNDLNHMSKGNLAGIYTFDEPYQGQLQSYGLIEDMLKNTKIDIFTATYDYTYRQMVIDKAKDLSYDHIENFLKSAEPSIIATDIYPISPDLNWNEAPAGEDSYLFLQNTLDVKLHKEYYKAKLYAAKEPTRKFYPIVQTFGRWGVIGKDAQWTSWIRPPLATQKMLNYFPLCYGVDGIFHYRVQSYQDEAEIGDHCAMTALRSKGTYGKPRIDRITYQAIQETNPKVELYGSILKQYKWLDTEAILSTGTKSKNPAKVGLAGLRVERSKGLYEGYIQIGYFVNANSEPAVMAVNRRTNYFQPGEIKDPKLVPPDRFEDYFPQAAPQTLLLEFSKEANQNFGYPAYTDPADGSLYLPVNGVIAVSIPAGEARLLQMISSLPETLNGKMSISGKAMAQGDLKLDKKAKLILKEDSRLILKPGSTLVITEKAQLLVEGELELQPGARIIVHGNLIDKGRIMASEDAIIYQRPVKRGFWQKLFGKKTKP